ncbi:hypothetical protein AXG93_1630s1250 [Marchantia polymorpha subsp. ruderalis]|uniref:HTH CENPB-type domain-containing protein n=1 Tax=Marchantia polymorpha subsp. ruderalis TaxID=1480154 RepID=A0A176VQM6_MARPO|nr:hypothetical protein AXG93_1630s1250 [Marchantia polymorpha subsp. ruderalis]
MSKAMELRDAFGICDTEFKLSHGWLQKFKTRHGIKCYYLHGESVDAYEVGVALAMAKIPFILKKYDPEDIFNFDETDEDLGKLNVDLFQAMLWCVVAWHELDDQTIRSCWRKSAILPVEWNADINNSDERMKSQIEEAALELGNLIAALNLGLNVEGKPIEKLSSLEYINMEGEDDFEVEYSNDELVLLVQDGKEVFDSMEEDSMIFDSNDDEYNVVKLSETQKYAKDLLNFMASQDSIVCDSKSIILTS